MSIVQNIVSDSRKAKKGDRLLAELKDLKAKKSVIAKQEKQVIADLIAFFGIDSAGSYTTESSPFYLNKGEDSNPKRLDNAAIEERYAELGESVPVVYGSRLGALSLKVKK